LTETGRNNCLVKPWHHKTKKRPEGEEGERKRKTVSANVPKEANTIEM